MGTPYFRGKPFFEAKEWFPPLPLPRKLLGIFLGFVKKNNFPMIIDGFMGQSTNLYAFCNREKYTDPVSTSPFPGRFSLGGRGRNFPGTNPEGL